MLRKLFFSVISCILLPGYLWALGLGQLTILSGLDQPLHAEVPLLLSSNEKPADIKVQLANETDFAKLAIPRPDYLTHLQFKVETVKQQPVILITTPHAVVEPAWHFLLKIITPAGQILHAFTVLVDPVDEVASTHTATPYGPIKPHELLWDIAAKLRPNNEVSITQTMVALWMKNPQAFAHGNLNGLKIGQRLQIPSLEEIMALTYQQALAVIKEHQRAWHDAIKVPKSIESILNPKTAANNNLDDANEAPALENQSLSTAEQSNVLAEKQALQKVKQAHAKVQADYNNLQQQHAAVKNELKLKTTEAALLRQQLIELTQKVSQPSQGWLLRLLLGLVILLAIVGSLIYLIKTRRLTFADQAKLLAKISEKVARFRKTHAKGSLDTHIVPVSPEVIEPEITTAPLKPKQVIKNTEPVIEPLEEASIYFVYGRYEQAQKVLLKALEEQPQRLELQQKLLEVYAAQDDKAAFEKLANQIRASSADDNPEFWSHVHDLYRKYWPEQDENIEQSNHEATHEALISDEMPEIVLTDEDVMATKLEMARSCIEIGAIEDAKKILLDVKRLGDEAQRQEAERLLERLA